jgi:hypothetical protein
MSRRPVNVFGKPIEYDVGVTYDPTTTIGTPKILEPGIDDLSKETKDAVVKAISDTTRGSNDPEYRNRYPVGSSHVQIHLNDPDGNPSPFDYTPNSSERTNGTGRQFVESREETDALRNYSDSTAKSGRTLKTPGNISDTLKKGKTTLGQKQFDGNTLLKDGLPQIQETYVSPILSNNRFTAAGSRSVDSPVKMNPNHPESTLGSYREFRESTDGRDVRDGHLANVGTLLTVRATSELGSGGAYGSDGPDGTGASAQVLLPGTAQIGLIKVDVEELRAIDALKSLIEENTDAVNLDPNASNDHLINDTGSSSFGQMNNVLEPFSGLLPLGMLAASTALVIAMKLALKGLTVLLAAVTSAKQGTVKKDSQGRYILGSYVHSAAGASSFPPLPIPAKLLGLTDTVHDFEDCVDKGIETVFGESLGSSFERVLETPGFYGVLCRTIVRSAANIVIQVQNAVKGNPIQVAQNIIELVNVIRSSKVIAAINVMAAVGDTVLKQDERAALKEDILGYTKFSTSDALDDQIRVGKGRQQGRMQSALATSTSPSAFLFPRETVAAMTAYSQRFAGSVTPASLAAIKSRTTISSNFADTGNKIPEDVYKNLEAELDAEYVPFYFHDLRTNEIISFHAFLRSMSDDFNVESESIKPYGRIDPVKIYKSTERKIGIEFYILSTNKQDFDQMWWKINKLTTLVYPQWTKGSTMSIPGTEDTFIQPFSQLPSNSPLIRLRLGDLFRSNYSKFALARLFGLGQPDAFFNAKVEDGAITKIVDFAKAVDNFDLEALRDLTVDIEPGVYPAATALHPPPISIGKPDNLSSIVLQATEPAKIAEKKDDTTFVVKLTERDDDIFITVPIDQISVNKVQLNLTLSKRLGQGNSGSATDQATLDKINDFLRSNPSAPNNNAIVRSFESSSGKGLACMIDSLGFNWLDNIPWETEAYGSRAPKMCLVKLALTPIHDIAPGLDSNGFNRAPLYNVGEVMNGISGDSWDDVGMGRISFDSLRKKLRKVLK